MNFGTKVAPISVNKKQMIVGLLDNLCQQLEISDSQYQTATTRYKAVGSWLSESTVSHLNQAKIYPQGSIALGTAIKPIGRNEFDVDLVCYLPSLGDASDPIVVKALIGNRLKEHNIYRDRLEEKTRCWRINYANEFHLDITPSIINPRCLKGGELVPDKDLAQWKPTNPKGYIIKFEQYADMKPNFYFEEEIYTKVHADIAPLPEQTMSKQILKRIVQLLKRHRDHKFEGSNRSDLAPISVIITTLASKAYAQCVYQQKHTSPFDFITEVIRQMPIYIAIEMRSGKQYFNIENESTAGENFADKWNSDSRLALTFYEWHNDALASIESLQMLEGVDRFAETLSNKFGVNKEQVHDTLASMSNPISNARATGTLIVSPTLGMLTKPASGSVIVPKNMFFGR